MDNKVTLTIRDEKGRVRAVVPCPDTVSRALVETGFDLEMPCGGCGGCGKCRLLMTDGVPEPSDSDRMFLTDREIRSGYRLACTARITRDASVRLPEYTGNKITALTGNTFGSELQSPGTQIPGSPSSGSPSSQASVALDIGTTTIAATLIPPGGGAAFSGSCVNSGRKYGSDVLSRVTAYENGEGYRLTSLLRSDVEALVSGLMEEAQCNSLERVILSANTAMRHIFSGESCRGLMAHPFDPGDLSMRDIYIDQGVLSGVTITVIPGISAFVGGDIVSGLYYLSIPEKKEKALFLDLGTNAEIALYNGDRLFVTSAAAGPAFEGGEISCGTGSVPGAISSVWMDDEGNLSYRTIKDEAPVGICGSGLIGLLALLSRQGVLKEGYILPERYREQGFPVARTSLGDVISVTQKDMEALKLAVSAVRTGVDILLEKAGDTGLQGCRIYIAGGFGAGMRAEDFFSAGLIPKGFAGDVEISGNTSLLGAVKFLGSSAGEDFISLTGLARTVYLAEEKDFNERFLMNLTRMP